MDRPGALWQISAPPEATEAFSLRSPETLFSPVSRTVTVSSRLNPSGTGSLCKNEVSMQESS